MRIPPPPGWLFIGLVIVSLLVLVQHTVGAELVRESTVPSYKGRPPADPSVRGRCWCATHGPRGGCMRWVCPKR